MFINSTDLLSCQEVQVDQLLLMDLEIPKNKQGNYVKTQNCNLYHKKVSDLNFDESSTYFRNSLRPRVRFDKVQPHEPKLQ